MGKYYGFTPDIIKKMTLYQFQSYMNSIPELEKMLPLGTYQYTGESETKPKKPEIRQPGEPTPKLQPHEIAELIALAKRKGLKTPSRY